MFYSDEERSRCTKSGCRTPGIPPDYNLCTEHLNELMEKYTNDSNENDSNKNDPFMSWPNIVRDKLVEEIMKKADFLSDEGNPEEARGMYYVGEYIKTGTWKL